MNRIRIRSVFEFEQLFHSTRCNFHTASCHLSTHANKPSRISSCSFCMSCACKLHDVRWLSYKPDRLGISESYIFSIGFHHFYHKVGNFWSKEHLTENLQEICTPRSHNTFSYFVSKDLDKGSKNIRICKKDIWLCLFLGPACR